MENHIKQLDNKMFRGELKKVSLIENMPLEIQKMITSVSQTCLVNPEYVATSMLTCLASAIGNSLKTKINQDIYKPILYAILLGESSDGKSRVQDVFTLAPVKAKNSELNEKYKQEVEENSQLPNNKQKAIYRKRAMLNKGTIEGLYHALENNPKGLLFYRDELSGWLGNFNKYGSGKGDDAQAFMELWKGNPLDNVLVSKETALIEEPFVCILGSTTNNRIKDFGNNGKDKDGFLYRFLFCYPEKPNEPKTFTDTQIDEDVIKKYKAIWETLYNCNQKGEKTKVIPLTDEAFDLFKMKFNSLENRKFYAQDDTEKGVIGKIIDYIPRFALILEAISYALKETNLEEMKISAANMERACNMGDYFLENALKMQDLLERESENRYSNNLTEKQILFFESLPKQFISEEMGKIAEKLRIKNSTMYNWLNSFKKNGLVKMTEYGKFEKLIPNF